MMTTEGHWKRASSILDISILVVQGEACKGIISMIDVRRDENG